MTRRFGALPERAAGDRRLKLTHFRVLTAASARANRVGEPAWAPLSRLAEITSMAEREVRRTVKDLEEFGYLKRAPRFNSQGVQIANAYTIVLDQDEGGEEGVSTPGCRRGSAPPGGEGVSTPGEEGVTAPGGGGGSHPRGRRGPPPPPSRVDSEESTQKKEPSSSSPHAVKLETEVRLGLADSPDATAFLDALLLHAPATKRFTLVATIRKHGPGGMDPVGTWADLAEGLMAQGVLANGGGLNPNLLRACILNAKQHREAVDSGTLPATRPARSTPPRRGSGVADGLQRLAEGAKP